MQGYTNMQKIKDSTIRVRISKEIEEIFKELCEYEEKKPSEVLRALIESYISKHPITTKKIDVEFTIEQYPVTNPHSYYCYNITAMLKGNLEKIDGNEIIFILPEFVTDGREPYRVDSFYYHRKPISGYYSKNGRVLSVNFIDGTWKGVIFIYDDSMLENPEVFCFAQIKNALKKNILKAVSELHFLPSSYPLEDISNEYDVKST